MPRHGSGSNRLRPTKHQIRAAREYSGLTQSEADEIVWRSKGVWKRWESGQYPIDMAAWELFLFKTGQHDEYFA